MDLIFTLSNTIFFNQLLDVGVDEQSTIIGYDSFGNTKPTDDVCHG